MKGFAYRLDASAVVAAGLVAGLVTGLVLGATGCVVTTAAPAPRGIVVSGPPPAAIGEERPPPPAAHAAWVAGYWHWTGLQYAWIPGHWEALPPPGTVWRAPAYVQNSGAYFYEPGAWRPPSAPVAAPTAEAFH